MLPVFVFLSMDDHCSKCTASTHFSHADHRAESNIITYDYDPFYRLTAADYASTGSAQRSNGDYYRYTYDAVGNRLTQSSMVSGLSSMVDYAYDDANRLTSVNGVTYTWDANGNLLNDGVNTYTYDSANRLKSITGASTANLAYNGLGDRLSQNGVNYTLDLNTSLTQVLIDGTNTYLYGVGRIAQINMGTEYFLGDALGSVRQLVDSTGNITLAKSYQPYGTEASSMGNGLSSYGFTGEMVDSTGLLYLRARYYESGMGRFLTRDTWEGDINSPMSFNRWMYGYGNPVKYTDPSGLNPNCQHVYKSFCAYQRLSEIVSEEKPSSVNALIRLFSDSELYYYWGDWAGRTSKQRLGWILNVTRGSGAGGGRQYKSGIQKTELLDDALVCGLLPFQFGIDLSGDSGFAPEFQDQAFYNDPLLWGNPADTTEHLSTQVQHFLTAVAQSGFGEYGIRVMIGHEKLSDRGSSELQQMMSTTDADLQHWYRAVKADMDGDKFGRDTELWAIFNYESKVNFGEVDPNRVGNSIQDLRLDVKGYRFFQWVNENGSMHPSFAASWLRYNLQGKLW